MRAWKIVEYVNGQYKTLFHGVNGSRILETDKWLTAEQKLVRDGGGSSTKYWSGFTVFFDVGVAIDYLKLFKNIDTKIIIPVRVDCVFPKTHSRKPVYLAQQMFIPKGAQDVSRSS
jgi:hypothetical protein